MPRTNHGPYLSDERNASGFYEIRWTEGGRSKRKSTGEGDRRAAQRVYAEFLLALDGAVANEGSVTLGRCIDAYLADKDDVMDRAGQGKDFGHLRAHFGHITVRDLEDSDVQAYRQARADGLVTYRDPEGRVRGGKAAGDSTVRRELTMLAAAVAHGIKHKKFRDPHGRSVLKATDRLLLRLPAAAPPRDRWITKDEAARLLACASGSGGERLSRTYRYIVMLMFTASRKAPVVTLPWSRILLEDDPAKHAAGDYGMINFQDPGRKRTSKRRGWVPISAELYRVLARARQERVSEWYLDTPTEPVSGFQTAAKAAGLDDVSPHVLRHSWAVWAAQDGVDLYRIAGVLHDTVQTVEKNYLHHCPQHLRSAVNRRVFG